MRDVIANSTPGAFLNDHERNALRKIYSKPTMPSAGEQPEFPPFHVSDAFAHGGPIAAPQPAPIAAMSDDALYGAPTRDEKGEPIKPPKPPAPSGSRIPLVYDGPAIKAAMQRLKLDGDEPLAVETPETSPPTTNPTGWSGERDDAKARLCNYLAEHKPPLRLFFQGENWREEYTGKIVVKHNGHVLPQVVNYDIIGGWASYVGKDGLTYSAYGFITAEWMK